jgi:hypothetical protein
MNYGCDLYVYDAEEGVVIHVAANRVVGDIPKLAVWSADKRKEFFESYNAQMKFLETAERRPIGLPYDGESFYSLGKEETVETLKMLKDCGYVFPEEVLEWVVEEQ